MIGAAVIRRATVDDLEPMREIYNDVLLTTTAIFAEVPVSSEDYRARFEAKEERGFPTLAAEIGGSVIGFAGFGEFRAWPCYRHTVEHSVHVAAAARGRGIGRALLMDLTGEASLAGKHVLIGGIDATNAASLRLHDQLGFEQVGHMRQVGRKFDRWLDLVFMQKIL